MTSCACTSTIYTRGIKWCTIIWSPSFKISSFKCNPRQCLSLISIFPRLLTRIFLSHLTWLLFLILSKKSLESSVKRYMRGIKLFTIIWLPSFKISSFKCNIWSTSYMGGISCTSTRNIRGIKKCTIIWSHSFKF